LQYVFQKKILAMVRASKKIALRALRAKRAHKADEAKLRYLKSRLQLQTRQGRRKQKEIRRTVTGQENRLWGKRLEKVGHRARHMKSRLEHELVEEQKRAAKLARQALKSQRALETLPSAAKRLATQMQQHNALKIKQLIKSKAKLKVKVEKFRRELYAAKKKFITKNATIYGKGRANKKLVKLVHKVKDHMIDAEGRAQRNAMDAKLATDALAKILKKKTNNLTPKEQLNKLLSTPCEGDSCHDSGKYTAEHVQSPKMNAASAKASNLLAKGDREVAP